MTYTILVVVALILVSGFIAYFGDLLGRRMGKKRLTLFKMRPRYTAIVVTTITGMLISALVLATLVSVNSQFRKVIFKGEQIILRNKQLSVANAYLADRGKELKQEIARQRRELVSARKDAERAKAQRDKAISYVDHLRQEIAQRQKELFELSKRADAAQDELDQRRGEVKLAQAELRVAEESLARAKEKVAETESKLGVAQARLEATQARLAEEMSGGGEAADYVIRLRTSELAFHQGDEIVRGVIDSKQSEFEKRTAFFNLLELAGKRAIEGGAKAGENGRAVNVIYRKSAGKEGVLLVGDEDKYIGSALDKIISSNSDVLVQIVCGMSALPNSQVPVEIRLYLNGLVYKNGDKIAESVIDGSKSKGSVLLAINNLLQVDVANTAMHAGIVPVFGQGRRVALGDNGDEQADELLDLVAQIKSMNSPADVSVYATSDIRASDAITAGNIRLVAAKAK